MVKRYDIACTDYWDTYESDTGDYVKFDDYETLASEFDGLQEKYDKLVMKLGELYQEGL